MRGNLIDLTGKRFGRLTVIRMVGKDKWRNPYWECVCDCGNTHTTVGSQLRKGFCQSCGCLQKERAAEVKTIHGYTNTRLYSVFSGMKARCYNPKNPAYKFYGARGIKIHDRWLRDFNAFYDWAVENGYAEGLTIERKDVNGDYCPGNCEWIPFSKQNANKTSTHHISHNGERKTLNEWARELGINHSSLIDRLKRHDTETALTMPKGGAQL
jgi:hypothetical protein